MADEAPDLSWVDYAKDGTITVTNAKGETTKIKPGAAQKDSDKLIVAHMAKGKK